MKYTILLASIFAFSFSGFYISYDLTASYDGEIEGIDLDGGDYDSGALTLGYESDVKNSMAAGVSYDLIGLDYEGADDGEQFLNIYYKYFFPVSPDINIWGSVGYNIPQGDIDEADAGLSYGGGLSMKNGMGISYIIHNISGDIYGYELEQTTSRLSISYSF